MPLLREIAMNLSAKQQKIVDNITEQAPFLGIIPSINATHGISHSYEEVNSVTGLSLIDQMDATPTTVDSITGLNKKDLAFLAGEHYAPVQSVTQITDGSPATYLTKKYPSILKRTGSNIENQLIYNSFQKKAFAENAYQTMKTSTATTGFYSIMIIRMLEEETCLINNPSFSAGSSDLVRVTPMWNGGLGKDSSGVMSYGWYMMGSLGALTASTKAISVIANIDASNLPNTRNLDLALLDARAGDVGETVIVMNPTIKTELQTSIKFGKMQVTPADRNISTEFDTYNGFKIITTFNMADGTEAAQANPS